MGISVEAPTEGRKVVVDRDFGATVDEKVDLFTEEVCNSCLNSIFSIKMQAIVRARLKARNEAGESKYTDEECIEVGLAYVPAKASERTKKDPMDAVVKMVADGKMSKKDLIALIAKKIDDEEKQA